MTCNSHKCHCPPCQAVRELAEFRCEHGTVTEIWRDAEQRARAEHWKRRNRQHVIEQSGCCRAPLRCDCPNCQEYVDFHASRVRHYEGRHWIWQRRIEGWRKKDIRTLQLFGPVYKHVHFRPDGTFTAFVDEKFLGPKRVIFESNPVSHDVWNWWGRFAGIDAGKGDSSVASNGNIHITLAPSPWADPPKRGGGLGVVCKDCGWLHATGDCYWPGKEIETWSYHWKETTPMLSPLQLSILLWRAAHVNPRHTYPVSPSDTMGGHRGAIRALEAHKLIEFGSEQGEYSLTDKAKVLIGAITGLPLPVREPAPWTMPK